MSNCSLVRRSHLVTVPPGPHLSDALVSSPVVQGEDGSGAVGISGMGFEFGVDPNEDPELALVSWIACFFAFTLRVRYFIVVTKNSYLGGKIKVKCQGNYLCHC